MFWGRDLAKWQLKCSVVGPSKQAIELAISCSFISQCHLHTDFQLLRISNVAKPFRGKFVVSKPLVKKSLKDHSQRIVRSDPSEVFSLWNGASIKQPRQPCHGSIGTEQWAVIIERTLTVGGHLGYHDRCSWSQQKRLDSWQVHVLQRRSWWFWTYDNVYWWANTTMIGSLLGISVMVIEVRLCTPRNHYYVVYCKYWLIVSCYSWCFWFITVALVVILYTFKRHSHAFCTFPEL